MVRQSYTIRRMLKSVFHRHVQNFLLAAGLIALSAGDASAQMVSHSVWAGSDLIGRTAGPQLLRVGFCPDGSYGCPAYVPPERPPREHVSRWDPAPGPYDHAEPVEELPPCDDERYASRAYDKHALPPREHYDRRYDATCGIACWFARLRAGYCGRGCDYYHYRFYEYPEGKLYGHGRRRLACREH
jgi:hypothetical protein